MRTFMLRILGDSFQSDFNLTFFYIGSSMLGLFSG